jgi:hypothetical protein
MRNLVVGDITRDLALWSRENFPTSQLLTDDNFDFSINSADDFYTSLADLSRENFIQAILDADRVIYKKPGRWTDLDLRDQTHQIFYQTDRVIENFTIVDLDVDHGNLLSLYADRKSTGNQVWVTGCSFAYGIGVDSQERYGELFAEVSQLPVSFLAAPGTSIPWAADQLLRSNIKQGDIILWGLTSINRFETYKNRIELSITSTTLSNKWLDLNNKILRTAKDENIKLMCNRFITAIDKLTSQDKNELELALISDDRLMASIKSIFQVMNFCKQLDVKLIIFLHDLSTDEFEYFLMKYISLMDNFVHITPIIDYGNSGTQHPGPNTHRNWANELINFAREKKYI